MIKKVKTKTSTPGKASVKGSKPEKADLLSIFSGSDEDSAENSKAFDNPQEERGYDSSQGAKTPDMPLPSPGDPGKSGAQYSNPNFNLNTGQLTSKPKEQMSMKSIPLTDRAKEPLSTVQSNGDKISNLSDVKMSRPVLEKYPAANDIAQSNASFPSDFSSEFSPAKDGFRIESLDQRDQAKNELYQKVTEIQFQKVNEVKTELNTQASDKINQFTNPEVQADYFTSAAKDSITPDFFAKGDLAPSNVFSEYSSTTGEYGKGQLPQTKEASSTMSNNSSQAGQMSSPQRGADAISSAEGSNSFKGGSEFTKPSVSVDTSSKDQITSASDSSSMSSQKSNTSSNGFSAKSFFVSNFSPISPAISDVTSSQSNNTDSASSEVSTNMNI
jgi:hypothetical protein